MNGLHVSILKCPTGRCVFLYLSVVYIYSVKKWQNAIIYAQNWVIYIFFINFAPKMGLRRRDTQYGLICFRPCASFYDERLEWL